MGKPGGETVIPAFCMLELSIHTEDVVYVFMYNGVRFYVTVIAERLQGEGEVLQEFNKFKDDLDDPDNLFSFEEWILNAMDDFMREAAPTLAPSDRKPITLLEYFSPPTFAFELINEVGKLCAVQKDYDPKTYGDTSPRTQIVEFLPDDENGRLRSSSAVATLPSHCIPTEGVILRSVLPHVPFISASELERVDDGLRDEELSDIPQKVRRVGTGEVFFFKAGSKDHGHLREMEILSQIHRSGNFGIPFRTSRLAGLAVWDNNDEFLMGFLLEYIEGKTLAMRMGKASMAERTRWVYQVEATVKRLHQDGIVWGDVKPDNVIINSQGDAVVVDFGGGYTPEYIEPELQQTFQGDLKGLNQMAADMGVRYQFIMG